MDNTKQIKTADEIILQFTNEHSYESWGELMYDTHEPVQVDYTKQVMELYHAQFQHPVPDASQPAGNDAVRLIKELLMLCEDDGSVVEGFRTKEIILEMKTLTR